MSQSRAIIYIRVSTERQAEEGTGLEVQESVCLRKAQELDAEVVDVISDEGVSGAFYYSRPGIQQALACLEAGKASLLITMKLDRSGRDADALGLIRKRIHDAGAKLVLCDGMNFENNATGNLLFRVNAGFVEYEKEVIRERTMSGRRKRAEGGQQPARTQPPFGYHIVTKEDVLRELYPAEMLGKYVIIEEQATIARELFSRCRHGSSLRQLAKWLQVQGVATQRGGKAWYPSTVRYILSNPVYKGEPAFGRFQWRTDENRIQRGMKPAYGRPAPASDQVTLSCEALVDAATWAICQTRLQENPHLLSGPAARRHMLTGLLRCPRCGRSMASELEDGRTLYYHCPQSRPSHSIARTVCTKKRHRSDRIEATLIRDLCSLAQRPERFTDALRTFARKTRQKQIPCEAAGKLREEAAELDRQEEATAKAQVAAMMQGRSTEVYDRLLAEMDNRRRALQARLNELEVYQDEPEKIDFQTDTERIMEVMRRVECVLNAEELTPAEKHQILAALIQRIVPDGDDAYRVELRSSVSGSAQGLESVQMISIHWPAGASR